MLVISNITVNLSRKVRSYFKSHICKVLIKFYSVIGRKFIDDFVKAFIRYILPGAPEELILAISEELTKESRIASVASHLGFNYLVRTAEFPPSQQTISAAFASLIASLHPVRYFAVFLIFSVSVLFSRLSFLTG